MTLTVARLASALALFAVSIGVHAFCFVGAPDLATVTEFYDAASDRYYSSWATVTSPGSCNPPQNFQPAPAGATRTGLDWTTQGYPGGGAFEVCVFRAEGQAEPASLFLTINPGECAALSGPGSGWTRLPGTRTPGGMPSLAAFEVDRATNACRAGFIPVHRFVNRDWPTRGNHRYVADARVREEMRSRRNWVEEGIAFCIFGSGRPPLVRGDFPALSPAPGLGPEFGGDRPCAGGWDSFGACIFGSNMPAFETATGLLDPPQQAPYSFVTGAASASAEVVGYSGSATGTSRSFVQVLNYKPGAGIYITSRDRTTGTISSVRAVTPIAFGHSVQPFAANYEVDMDLVLAYQLFVKQVRAEPTADAYVQPLVTLRDLRSGRSLELSAGAIGTPAAVDFATRDAATGNVLVFASLAPSSAFGRSTRLPSLRTARVFDADHSWGWGGDFAWRVNRRELAAILAAARQVDASLSGEPADYVIDSFGIKGEVAGDASIGFNLQRMSVSVERP